MGLKVFYDIEFFLEQLLQFRSSEKFLGVGRSHPDRIFLAEISAKSRFSAEIRYFWGLGDPDTTVRCATGREWVKILQIYLIDTPT